MQWPPSKFCSLSCTWAGDFLEPDEVAFAVLLRGYGNANPPNWPRIDSTLTTMQLKYGLPPAASELCLSSPTGRVVFFERLLPRASGLGGTDIGFVVSLFYMFLVMRCRQWPRRVWRRAHSRWKQLGADGLLSSSLSPSLTASYNALLEICCRTNDVERGEDIIDRMHSDEVVPDEFTEAAVANRRVLRSYFRKVFS